MSTQHTPGPWKAFDSIGKHVRADKWDITHEDCGSLAYAPILDSEGRVVSFAVSHSRHFGTRDIAPDVRLIAAAPELLAALRDLLEDCQNYNYPDSEHGCDCISNAYAAIAKATGSAS